MIECLITGCGFFDAASNRYAWGDLHRVGSALVFNACLEEGETRWEYGRPPPTDRPLVTFLGSNYFERRGVLVFSGLYVEMNDEAKVRAQWVAPRNCRHYGAVAAPEIGANWMRCPDCGREYDPTHPGRIQSRNSFVNKIK